jgi:hypothetical protein
METFVVALGLLLAPTELAEVGCPQAPLSSETFPLYVLPKPIGQ